MKVTHTFNISDTAVIEFDKGTALEVKTIAYVRANFIFVDSGQKLHDVYGIGQEQTIKNSTHDLASEVSLGRMSISGG